MRVFTLCRTRKDRSKDNYQLESKLCAILACLGVNSNESEDETPPDCELASLRFGGGEKRYKRRWRRSMKTLRR